MIFKSLDRKENRFCTFGFCLCTMSCVDRRNCTRHIIIMCTEIHYCFHNIIINRNTISTFRIAILFFFWNLSEWKPLVSSYRYHLRHCIILLNTSVPIPTVLRVFGKSVRYSFSSAIFSFYIYKILRI